MLGLGYGSKSGSKSTEKESEYLDQQRKRENFQFWFSSIIAVVSLFVSLSALAVSVIAILKN